MLKTHLILGTYNHLPEGLDDNAFERTYQTCYRPFLSVLNRFPEIQAALYYSGSLLKRLETLHPEYLMLLEEMSARRQIELLGGGFYAPLLPLIPGSDRLGQIELLTTYLRKSFGKRPRGCWLTEYAWEPWLASTLQASGMDYTLLLDRQFREASGHATIELSPVVTEDQGRCLTVLPVRDCSSSFGEPCGFVEAAEAAEACALTVLMLQGEHIEGLWEASGLESPDLYMERTFAWFRKNSLEAETTTPSRYLKTRRVTSKLYFPGSASTRFMRAIAAPGSTAACGSLRAAIVRHAGVSALYSRMYYVHLLIGQLRGDKSRKKTAVEDLWKGQGGDAYWMSPGGGIDNPSIRETAYRSLIDAEMTTRQKAVFAPGIVRADVDFDGGKEYIYQGTELNVYVHARGAVISELDALKARRNLCDLFADAPEGDTSRKQCFVDRLYAEAPDMDRAVAPWKGDIGPFSTHHYDEMTDVDQQPSMSFVKDGVVGIGGAKRSIAITKRFSFNKKTVRVAYSIQNRSDATAVFHFGVELNLSLGPEPLEAILADTVHIELSGLSADRGLSLGSPSRLMVRGAGPVKAVSIVPSVPALMTAASIGKTARQGTSLLLTWPLELSSDATWSAEVLLSIQE
jgi:alpha-amylase